MHKNSEDEAHMPEHHFNQPLNRRGFTLAEVVIGCALAGAVALITSGLFKAGFVTYNYVYRQTRTLSGARKAILGDGSHFGLVWASQSASSSGSLSPSVLTLVPPAGVNTVFSVQGGQLYQSYLGVQTLQAEPVSELAVSYYNLDNSGRIVISTVAASASFVTTKLVMKGRSQNDKTYNFISGARMRNRL